MDKHGAARFFLPSTDFSFLLSLFSFCLPPIFHIPHPHPFFFFYWTLFLCPSTIQGIPQAVLPPLPKRPALEKTNGATAVFNTGIFQYQQALANMQLQQHTAFLPPGKCQRVPGGVGGRELWGSTSRRAVPQCGAAVLSGGCWQGGCFPPVLFRGWVGVFLSNIKISTVLCPPKSELEIFSLVPLSLN